MPDASYNQFKVILIQLIQWFTHQFLQLIPVLNFRFLAPAVNSQPLALQDNQDMTVDSSQLHQGTLEDHKPGYDHYH